MIACDVTDDVSMVAGDTPEDVATTILAAAQDRSLRLSSSLNTRRTGRYA
jgi:hypothetical protein